MNSVYFAIITGLSIGALGSFHCIGMCGPIALSLPIHSGNGFQKTLSILLYNIGRALTYAVMGLIFGLLGSSLNVFGLQQWLSIIAGCLILFLLFFSTFNPGSKIVNSRFNGLIKEKLSGFLSADKSTFSYLVIGLLNGWLPCGLVYVAIAASFALGNVWESTLLMFAFGLGTLPIMASLMLFGKFISQQTRGVINKLVPFVIGIMAILLISRGLNLGIPYLSPSYNKQEQKVEECCLPKP
jgi:uncharacterized protein